jgi:hypothetical protein
MNGGRPPLSGYFNIVSRPGIVPPCRFMPAFPPLPANPRIKIVPSFAELVATPFAGGVNALCWPRELPGDFAAVVQALGTGEGVTTLDAARLNALELGAEGRLARDVLLADLQLLETQGLAPVLNCIHAYPHDEYNATVPTDVFSFHADSAPVEAATWLCTYHGAPSEGLRNEEALRRIEVPATRAALLRNTAGPMMRTSPSISAKTATTCTTRRCRRPSPIPLVSDISGASRSTGPAARYPRACTAPRPPSPASRACC